MSFLALSVIEYIASLWLSSLFCKTGTQYCSLCRITVGLAEVMLVGNVFEGDIERLIVTWRQIPYC